MKSVADRDVRTVEELYRMVDSVLRLNGITHAIAGADIAQSNNQ
jgi:hypothetical protein